MSDIVITKHAEKRIRKRVGIPKKGCKKHVQVVATKGVRLCNDSRSRVRQWESWAQNNYNADVFYKHSEFIYAFIRKQKSKKNSDLILVTVLPVPYWLR